MCTCAKYQTPLNNQQPCLGEGISVRGQGEQKGWRIDMVDVLCILYMKIELQILLKWF
jgi:hypothetical protein